VGRPWERADADQGARRIRRLPIDDDGELERTVMVKIHGAVGNLGSPERDAAAAALRFVVTSVAVEEREAALENVDLSIENR
jgi:hypothetical protein